MQTQYDKLLKELLGFISSKHVEIAQAIKDLNLEDGPKDSLQENIESMYKLAEYSGGLTVVRELSKLLSLAMDYTDETTV